MQSGRWNFRLRSKFIAGLWLALCLCGHNNAQTWQRLGPEGGMVVSLGTAPQGAGLYLGTADGHVFYSGNRAQSWELRGRVGVRLDAVVTRLVPDPQVANRLYASVWYQAAEGGGGVFRSDDGGRTWTLMGLGDQAVRALEMAPSRPDVLVAGTRTGVFRSENSGRNWERVSAIEDPELHNVDSLAIDPHNPDLIYVGTYHLPWKTVDAGKSWVPVMAGIIDDSDIMNLRIDATNPARLFMSACSGIYRSENQGAQWTKLQGIPYSARRTQAIVQDPGNPNTLFAGTTEGLWVTRDGGENWTRTTPKDWDVNSVVVLNANEGNAERLVLGTEGRGIEISDDAGLHFTEANRGFTHSVVTQLLADSRDSTHLVMTTQNADERILESRDSGKTWSSVSLTVDTRVKSANLSADQLQQVYSSPWGWLLRVADGKFWLRDEGRNRWDEWKLHVPPVGTSGKPGARQVTPKNREVSVQASGAQIAFSEDAVFIPTSNGLLRCVSSGTCTVLKAFGPGGEIHAVRVSLSGQDLLVVRDGKLGTSINGGGSASWRDLPVGSDQMLWLDVADSDTSPKLILGTTVGLYISKESDAPWQKIRGGLPETAVTRWLRHGTLWACAERNGGMYVSLDNGATWQRVDRDAERGQFAALLPVAEGLLAASESEGLLRFDLAVPKDTTSK
jgi:photosystem II stability/assembly factor-like uncharacterized protein